MAPATKACLLAALLAVAACKDAPPPPPDAGAPPPPAAARASAEPTRAAVHTPLLVGTTTLVEPNPLRLPARKVALEPGKRVFTFSDQMLANARVGSTLVLYAATALGLEGDDLIIEGRGGPSYKVHSAYAIPVPDEPKLKVGDAVLTEWNGVMKHAAVTRFVKDRVGVRFTDMDTRSPETLLVAGKGKPGAAGTGKAVRFLKQVDGLVPGNYAALRQEPPADADAGAPQEPSWSHVLLISPSADAPSPQRTWFALGFGGAAMIVKEADLRPIPVKYSPKVGAHVWAEWAGTMRTATVQSAEDPALFVVKFDRAGRPATVGWGLVMPPLADAP